jgi:broad specificity phosphatase PhoE
VVLSLISSGIIGWGVTEHMRENINQSYCTLYLVRHGETEWNALGRIQGQLDSTLTQQGIIEAQKLAEQLKSINFNAIYSSDLSRAAKTAEILKRDRQLAVITHQDLRERTFGKYDGHLGVDYEKATSHLLTKYKKLIDEEKWQFKFADDYESDQELVDRFAFRLRKIAVAYLSKTILVVTHGGNLRTFLTHVGFAAYGELTPGTFKNAGYVKVRSDGKNFVIDEVKGIDKAKGIKTVTL